MKQALAFFINPDAMRHMDFVTAFYGSSDAKPEEVQAMNELINRDNYTLTAAFDIPEDKTHASLFYLTQNIESNWLEDIADQPNTVFAGEKPIARSSMVGDIFMVRDGTTVEAYAVVSRGYRKLDDEQVNILIGMLW